MKKKEPNYPLFDKESARLCAAIAVMIGSDVFVGGIKGVGTSAIKKEIDKCLPIYSFRGKKHKDCLPLLSFPKRDKKVLLQMSCLICHTVIQVDQY